MFPEATAEFGRDDAEVRDLHRIILGNAPQLVPACQRAARAVRPPRCDEQLNGRIGEMPSDLVIGPVPAVEPMKRFAYGTIAGTVQIRRRLGDARDGDFRKSPEGGPELRGRAEFEIGAGCLHVRNLRVTF